MKTKLFSVFLMFLLGTFVFAQSIKFVSANTGDPLAKVTIFKSNGDLLATSDIEGKVLKQELSPMNENYVLIYENYNIGTLKPEDLNADVIKLNDRTRELQAVVIKSSAKAKYMFVRGYFNVYMTVDKQLNVYADGIATYVFDNETKKLKNVKIEQYRAFTKDNKDFDRKNAGTIVFDSFLQIPDLQDIGKMNAYKTKPNSGYKEVETKDASKMQYQQLALQEKAFSIFGYRLFDFNYLNSAIFTNNKFQLRDFTEYNELMNFKLKHKSEPEFHQLIKNANFIATEINFGNEDNIPRVRLNPSQSFYHYEYWKAKGFPNMQPVFSSFFKDSLKEKNNSAKK